LKDKRWPTLMFSCSVWNQITACCWPCFLPDMLIRLTVNWMCFNICCFANLIAYMFYLISSLKGIFVFLSRLFEDH
jgi:hypothetical protein